MADSQKIRVALFGRFCKGDCEPDSVQDRKDKLRKEAKKRNYEVVDEFWEEGLALEATLDEREEVQEMMRLVWQEELDIDGVFMAELADLGWHGRREHVTFTTFFETNDVAIITYETTYDPDDWAIALSF